MKLPRPRGEISEGVIAALRTGTAIPEPLAVVPENVLDDEDLQLALYVLYELHYSGFDGVQGDPEWNPGLLALRSGLEERFEAALTADVERRPDIGADELPPLLFELARNDDGPSLSRHLGGRGTLDQFREFMVHRSAYQLKEADPHSWAIPRLYGAPKAALLEVQFDEYGSGDPDRMHSKLFADAMDALGLDSSYGAYLDELPASTLATVNLMSMFGLHRRSRGAIVGHLAMFEITSPEPNRRYANGLRRLGLERATPFFDEHVVADSIHENVAAYDLAGALARQQPGLAADIAFGAECLLMVEARWADHVLTCWSEGVTSLHGDAVPTSEAAA